MGVDVTLELGDIDVLRDEVIERAAEKLLGDHELTEKLRLRATRISDEEIRAVVQPAIEEAWTKAIQPTNTWGEGKGEPVTVREFVVERTRKFLTEPDPTDRSQLGRERRTRLQVFLEQEVDSVVQRELREALDEARQEVVGRVKEKAAEVIAETIGKMAVR